MTQRIIVTAVELADGDRLPAKAGEYRFLYHDDEPEPRQPCGILFACPCGCDRHGTIVFAGRGRGDPEWTVTGTWPRVSVTPSIGMRPWVGEPGPFHWHGFLRDGVFETC